MKLVFSDRLKPGMVSAQDVFPPNNFVIPYVRKGTLLTDRLIGEIQKLGIRFLYITDDSAPPGLGMSLPAAAQPGPVSQKLSPELKREAIDTLQEMFATVAINPGDVHASAQIVRHVDRVVNQLVESLHRDAKMLVNINDLKSYDDYTFHHSLSVTVLAIAIGQHLSFSRAELSEIGMCAMMHDIGKIFVPIEVIQKTSRLDDNEFRAVKTHSSAGYDYVHQAKIGGERLWEGVLYHHEKADGTGYPKGLRGKEIPLFSRIISVGDVYDALTSNRPYRIPMQPAEAIEYIMGGAGSSFDYDIVEAFVKKVDIYPVASRVQLSNGMTATVLDNKNQMRPVIRLESGEVMDLFSDRERLNIVITNLISS